MQLIVLIQLVLHAGTQWIPGRLLTCYEVGSFYLFFINVLSMDAIGIIEGKNTLLF